MHFPNLFSLEILTCPLKSDFNLKYYKQLALAPLLEEYLTSYFLKMNDQTPPTDIDSLLVQLGEFSYSCMLTSLILLSFNL